MGPRLTLAGLAALAVTLLLPALGLSLSGDFQKSPGVPWVCYAMVPGHPSPKGEFVDVYPPSTSEAEAVAACASYAAGTHASCPSPYPYCGIPHELEAWGEFRARFNAVATARLSWTAPTLLENGEPLTDLAGFRIYGDGELIASVGPTVTATSVPAGRCPYTVTAWRTGTDAGGAALDLESQPSNEACK